MKKRLLIIDDDMMLNKINEKILHASGLVSELHISCNGKDALAYLKLRIEKNYPLPHIIVLDLEMPMLDGFQFMDEVKKLDLRKTQTIEIVVFTSSSKPSDKEKALSKGVRHYLSKPYLLRGLRDVISRLHVEEEKKVFGL